MNVPLHTAFLKSDIVSRVVNLVVRKHLPMEGVDLILGNDLIAVMTCLKLWNVLCLYYQILTLMYLL